MWLSLWRVWPETLEEEGEEPRAERKIDRWNYIASFVDSEPPERFIIIFCPTDSLSDVMKWTQTRVRVKDS